MWMCLGDFNDISHPREKNGGMRKSQRLVDAFNSMIEDIQKEDFGGKRETVYLVQ